MPLITLSSYQRLLDHRVALWISGLLLLMLPLAIVWFLQDRIYWPIALCLMLVMVGVMLACWVRNKPISLTLILVIAMAGRLSFLMLDPTLSDDLYRYVWDGDLFVSGLNPYLSLPSDVVHEAKHGSILYELMNSPKYYSVYPPVSQFFFALASWISGGSALLAIFVMKVLVGLMELVALLLLARMVQWRGLILYAWNPVIMVETWGQGHSEGIAVGLIVLGLWALQNRLLTISLISITLAGWVKLFPLLLVPFVLRRTGWRYIFAPIIVSVFVWLPFALPPEELVTGLRNIGQSVKLYSNFFEFNAGIYYTLRWLLDDVLRPAITNVWVGHHVGKVMQVIFLLWCGWLFWIDRGAKRPLHEIGLWMFGGFILLSTTIHPWYFVLILALIALANRVSWILLWLAIASQSTYLFYSHDLHFEMVLIVWSVWVFLIIWKYVPILCQRTLRSRARNKDSMMR